jgi:hypothetical protein
VRAWRTTGIKRVEGNRVSYQENFAKKMLIKPFSKKIILT